MNGSCTDQYSQEGSDDHGTYGDCGGRLCGPGVRRASIGEQCDCHPAAGARLDVSDAWPEISILVFDPTGTELLGTEHLVRPDLYNGQPCPNDPDPVTGGYAILGNGYYGCHHFVP